MRGFITLLLLCAVSSVAAQNQRYNIRGQILDRTSREPVPFATVIVEEQPTLGDSADEQGRFEIVGVKPGIYRFGAYSLGYEPAISAEYIVSANSSPIEITMEESATKLDTLVVVQSIFDGVIQSPVSLRKVGLQQIEQSAGANRDLSRVVQSLPGVAFSPASYRNDLIIRGGSPAENRFYIDGFELPNINHFSTQGASGGPVGLINADLIREIEFYSGAFPVSKSGALSSILDIKLRDGNSEEQNFKFTLGASEVALSGSGHLSPKTNYLFSVRRSYLQLLFKALGLPFLPDYIDSQIKIRTKLTPRDEINFLAVGALDDMSLNDDASTPTGKYILGYLPQIEQNTYTLGVSYRHFSGDSAFGLYLTHSSVTNRNTKYHNNDQSSDENLLLRLQSNEQWSIIRNENRTYLEEWTLRYGAKLGYNHYSTSSVRAVAREPRAEYSAKLGFVDWGLFASAEYSDSDERFSASLGVRADGSNYSVRSSQLWRQLSPRASLSYKINEKIALNAGSGIYHQLPPFTALAYLSEGEAVNRGLNYTRVWESTLGVSLRPRRELKLSVEGFYKDYDDLLLSLADGIPLSDKGADYGTIGNEALAQGVDGRAYGVEIMARAEVDSRLSAIASLTLFRSEYRTSRESAYIASAWDNRVIFNMSGSYKLPKRWAVALKLSAIGGAPYTPYDLDQSSLVSTWDTSGRALLDYSRYNTLRLPAYGQLDIRVDKSYYFEKWGFSIYLDLQNLFVSKFKSADIPISTGVVDDPTLPIDEQRYILDFIPSESGTLLPTVGVSIEF